MPEMPAFSLLIPVYNWPVAPLLESLEKARKSYSGKLQILVWDDASLPVCQIQNRIDALKFGIEYQQFDKNLGRATIRNVLAKHAMYENLIFLDCDSTVPNSEFFHIYAPLINQYPVLIGGTCYEQTPPEPAIRLRWEYGRKREQLSAKHRNQSVFSAITINNMAIKADLFNKIKLDESIKKYGHEDTLFGFELKKRNIVAFHVDNPVFHTGLDDNYVFLDKSLQAIHNLNRLHQSYPLLPKSKLIKHADFLNKTKLDSVFGFVLNMIMPIIQNNLCSANPKLLLFDIWKLGQLLQLRKKQIV